MSGQARFARLDPQLRKAHLVDATLLCLQRHGFKDSLNPRTFTPEQGIGICEAWIDGLVGGGHRRFAAGA